MFFVKKILKLIFQLIKVVVGIFRCEWTDGRFTLQTRVCLRCKYKIINTTQKTEGGTIFLRENPNWEKSREGGGKFTIICRIKGNTGMYCNFFELGLDERKSSPSRWRRRSIYTELLLLRRIERRRDTYFMIFMSVFVVTAAIAGVMVEIACRKFCHYLGVLANLMTNDAELKTQCNTLYVIKEYSWIPREGLCTISSKFL